MQKGIIHIQLQSIIYYNKEQNHFAGARKNLSQNGNISGKSNHVSGSSVFSANFKRSKDKHGNANDMRYKY